MFNAGAFLMQNRIQNYQWGSKGKNAFIPAFLECDYDNELPYAELWIGGHSKAPSLLSISGKCLSLPELIEKYPIEILGKYVFKKFNGQFPFLLKVLSIAEVLSIQIHPNKAQAQKLHLKDFKNYPDNNHKPEIAIAIDSLTALAGFKSMNEIVELLKDFQEIFDLAQDTSLDNLDQLLDKDEVYQNNFLKNLYSNINQISISDEERMIRVIDCISVRLINSGNKYEDIKKLFFDLKDKYGYDVGLFSLFLLKMVKLNEGEAIFIDAGVPHAYIKGNIIECMANSDNVIRAGFTPKFKDILSLIEMVRYDLDAINIFKPDLKKDIINYDTPADEFKISRIRMQQGFEQINKTSGRPEIILILDGNINLSTNYSAIKQNFKKGHSVFIPAMYHEYTIQAESNSLIIRSSVP